MLNILMREDLNLNENLNEFLKEWEYHTNVLSSNDIIEFYGFTKDPNTSKYMVVMYYANKGNLRENLTRIVVNNWNQKLDMLYRIISGLNLMKKCWNENPLKRPSSKEVLEIIKKWIFRPKDYEINEELKSNIMEFINAPIGHSDLATKSHPKACFTSRLLDFTSKKLNEILESENSQASVKTNEMLVSEDLNDCVIKGLGSLGESTSKKSNEISENEDSQASVKANEMLVSEDLNDCVIKGLGSLGESTSKKSNEISENEDSQASVKANEMLVSEDLNDCVIKGLGSLGESTSKKSNEISENEDSQASVKANEMLVSEDLNDCVIKGLGSLDIKADENQTNHCLFLK
ncbi:unnamed protein product [Rhizophagus irregularis]|nr:unnamed protein product [Rhizophagus irregularis]